MGNRVTLGDVSKYFSFPSIPPVFYVPIMHLLSPLYSLDMDSQLQKKLVEGGDRKQGKCEYMDCDLPGAMLITKLKSGP